MELTLKRIYKGETYTIGKLYIDGAYFCDTIEDKVRDLPSICPDTPRWLTCKCKQKVYGGTAIPAGTYKVTMENSTRFKRVLPYLNKVPHFLGILIHSGNTEKDSAGCILVGFNKIKGRIVDSRATSDKLNTILSKEKSIAIEII